MKKRLISLLLVLTLLSALPLPVLGATAGLHNFVATESYVDGCFSDVPAGHVFASNVRTAYELGLVQGYGERFGVGSSITRLASVIIACRLHAIYNTGTRDTGEDAAADTRTHYLAYASENGIYCDFADTGKAATRAEFARILASALPESALTAKNDVADGAIPDVAADAAIYRLYRAGVLVGSDARGTFYPDSAITRGAAVAIATRMCREDLRQSLMLTKQPEPQEPTKQEETQQPTETRATYEEVLTTLLALTYEGEPYAEVNGNEPTFLDTEVTRNSYEYYSPLDSLGRCGYAMASVGTDLMPTEKRGNISSVKPTAWHSVQYDIVSGKSLYNRCHLIGWQLTGENANRQNLITGTRYLNVDGMLPFEDEVAAYVKTTGYHVLYRVTPVFDGSDLLADGVLMEAESVEDGGKAVSFCVYCFNVQPGIWLDYATGESTLAD